MVCFKSVSAAVLLTLVVAALNGSVLSSTCKQPSPSPSHVVTFATTLRAGVPFNASVSLLKDPSGPVHLHFALKDHNGSKTHFSHEVTMEGLSSTIALTLPDRVPLGSYLMVVKAKGALTFHQSATVSVESGSSLLLIQTDKAIYRAGQNVSIRVIALQLPSLTPKEGQVTIEITDPQSNKVNRWVENATGYGVVSKQIAISEFPLLGSWTVKAMMGSDTEQKSFSVQEYLLPLFAVKINVTSYITVKDTSVGGRITAIYTYGKRVKGEVSITLRRKSGGPVPNRLTTMKVDGEVGFDLDMKEYLNTRYLSPTSEDDPLVVECNVTETLTGRVVSAREEIGMTKSAVQIRLAKGSPRTFKPGMDYNAQVHVARPDGSPLDGSTQSLSVIVSEDPSHFWSRQGSISAHTFAVPANGIVSLHIPTLPDKREGAIFLKMTYGDDVDSLVTVELNRFHSHSHSYLQIRRLDEGQSAPQPGSEIAYSCEGVPSEQTLHFQVVNERSGVVSMGTTTVRTFLVDVSDAMAPRSTLIVYYVTSAGELVVDVASFDVARDVLANKVSVTFDTEERLPGGKTSVRVKAAPHSYVGLLAVDQSVLLFKSGNDLSIEQVTAAVGAKSTLPIAEMTSARATLQAVGVAMLSDACIPHGLDAVFEDSRDAASPMVRAPLRTRKHFPETWFFVDVTTNAAGHATLEETVPDSITTWVLSAFAVSTSDGLGIAPVNAKLRVFQPFFISVNMPHSIVYGEQVALQVTVFNYLKHELKDVRVTLSQADGNQKKAKGKQTDFFAVGPTGRTDKPKADWTIIIESIPADEGKTVDFPVQPSKVGAVVFRVEARRADGGGDAVEKRLVVKRNGVEQSIVKDVTIHLSNEIPMNQSVSIALPSNVIHGSVLTNVIVYGDPLTPSMNNLDHLVALPSGCGEQNMISLTPNIFVGKYLQSKNQFNGTIRDKAVSHMEKGYQRQLSYRHPLNGGYSAFGVSDRSASSWLTAFVVRSFRQAGQFVFIDENVLSTAQQWLIQQQNEDGSFKEPGKVIHSEMKGGMKSPASLTAYVVIGLLEGEHHPWENVTRAVDRAATFLESHVASVQDAYSLAITTYALHLAGRNSSADRAFVRLNAMAKVEGGTKHWPSGLTSHSVETTAYVLIVYSYRGMAKEAAGIVQWLISQRSALGGFRSTQDTVMALQALSCQGLSEAMRVRVQVRGDHLNERSWQVTKDNSSLAEPWEVEKHWPPGLVALNITAQGTGKAHVQVVVSYNSPAQTNSSRLVIRPVVLQETACAITVNACAMSTNGTTGMALVQVEIPTGFTANAVELKKVVDDKKHRDLQRTEVKDGKIVLYFDKLDSQENCVPVYMDREHIGGKLAQVYAHVVDYYSPEIRQSAPIRLDKLQNSFFKTCQDSDS